MPLGRWSSSIVKEIQAKIWKKGLSKKPIQHFEKSNVVNHIDIQYREFHMYLIISYKFTNHN